MIVKNKEWTDLNPWLSLSLLPGLGPVWTHKIIDKVGRPEVIFSLSQSKLKDLLPSRLVRSIIKLPGDIRVNQKLELAKIWLEASDAHHILTPDSHFYPDSLRQLEDAPVVLYVIGNVELLSEPQIGVVGSRRPTPGGQRVALEFSEKLAQSGLVITSGMAMGIDAAAHHGALKAEGGTVAVLGTGVDQIYPIRHSDLYKLIAKQGALLSEFPLGTKPFAGNFPKRNRILTGLSLAVLVVEAALESGSLISARLACEQGRDVFAVPGSVMNPMSRGCHKLIRDGALLVETAEDILIELAPQLRTISSVSSTDLPLGLKEERLDPVRLKVVEAMGFDVVSVDQISAVSGISSVELSIILLEMELEGVIESTIGGFIRVK